MEEMTPDQTLQELLKPRYKVIADYPGSIFKVGEVFYSLSGKIYCDPDSVKFADFPHLFKRLEWWEYRDASEMPEYVKANPDGILEHLAKSGQVFDARGKWELEIENYWLVISEGHHIHASHLLPATESEYMEYTKSKTV